MEFAFEKMDDDPVLLPCRARTCYRVFFNGKPIGFVWSIEEFSYRGTQGWNRGLRIRDYHPIVWRFAKSIDYSERGQPGYNRKFCAERLAEKSK